MQDDTETSGSDGEERKIRKLTEAEWAELTEFYELGQKGIVELSAEFGISRQAISKRFQANGVVKGSRAGEVKAAVNKGVTQAAQQQAAQQTQERYADKRTDWIEETRIHGYQTMRQAAVIINKKMVDTFKSGTSPAAIMDELKALKFWQESLIKNFDFRLNRLLNAADAVNEQDLPSLNISDLTTEDIINHYRENGMIDETDDLNEIIQQVEATQLENGNS